MSRYMEDLSGQKFGSLVVKNEVIRDSHWRYKWLCKCKCGNEKFIYAHNLKSGGSTNCGCERAKKVSEAVKNYHKKRASMKEANIIKPI